MSAPFGLDEMAKVCGPNPLVALSSWRADGVVRLRQPEVRGYSRLALAAGIRCLKGALH
jgi:hypothetical protein